MATAKSLTRVEWIARCLDLAQERHTIGTPRHVGQNVHGAQLWQVPSRTHDGCYLVTAWPHRSFSCCCTAGSYAQPCCHVGAVLHAEEQRTETSEHSEAWSWWMAGGEW